MLRLDPPFAPHSIMLMLFQQFYPGDAFTYEFENGSFLEDVWLAVYNDPGDTGPLESGGDYYNFFVLDNYPASYNDSDDSSSPSNTSTAPPPKVTSFNNPAFPDPDVFQANLTSTGFTTGYFLRDQSLAVISIPTFDYDDQAIETFAAAVQDFLIKAKAAGMTKVLIDLQQNEGGGFLLAYSVFKQFFPAIEPYAGSRLRAHQLANILGTTMSAYWQTLNQSNNYYQAGSADEWIATTRVNAETQRNFTSWAELYGPLQSGVGTFTETLRLNTTDYLYDYSALGQEDPPEVLLTPYSGNAPFPAEDIVMVSCALAKQKERG